MQFVKCVLVLCISFQLIYDVLSIDHDASEYDEIDDDVPPMAPKFDSDPDIRGFERMMLRDMADDEPEFFNEKETQIRDALLRSTQDARAQRKLSEMLPILKSLTEAQRLTLAALISTQTSTKSGKSLESKQVAEMFGERRNSIWLIITDLAKIIKKNMIEKTNGNSFEAATDYNANEKTNVNDDDVNDEFRSTLKLQRTKRSSRYDDDRPSYHEQKLNMTNFRGTPESNDQHAMESQTRIHVSLPNSNVSTAISSFEEIEHLALKDLNGTSSLPFSLTDNTNATNIENLPEPEMVIRPYRVRPRPISINIYLYVVDYPLHQIMGSIRRHRYAMLALLADNPTDWRIRMQEFKNKKRREDEENNIPSSGMCPSIVRYARPQKARSASGEWKYIVNTGQHTQTLRLEKCTSRCAQIYNYHRLLSWDNQRGLHIDIFKVPTCCSCQIDGYREKFPPVSAHAQDDQELYETRFSASDALYSLANTESEDFDGEVEESASEPYVASYRPIPHHTKKQRFDKRKKAKRPSNSLPGTYLALPNNKYEPDTQFKRKQSIPIANRASTVDDQAPVLIGGDDAPSQPQSSPTERPSKNGFTPIHVPTAKNVQQSGRLTPSKVLIKRVNYNYHPIIDFFFRDRAMKAAKAKENQSIGHSIVS